MAHSPSRHLPALLVAALLALIAAGPGAAQTTLPPPDVPTQGVPQTPAPDPTPAAPSATPSPTPTPSSPAPSTPATPSPATPTPATPDASTRQADAAARAQAARRARAQAAAERRRAMKAAAQRRRLAQDLSRIRTSAGVGAESLATAARAAPVAAAEPGSSDEGGHRAVLLLGLLAVAAVALGLALYAGATRRHTSLGNHRLELVGVSVACVLVLLLVAVGVV